MPDSETSRVDSRQIDFATFLFSCLPSSSHLSSLPLFPLFIPSFSSPSLSCLALPCLVMFSLLILSYLILSPVLLSSIPK